MGERHVAELECAEGDNLRVMLAAAKRLSKYESANVIGLRRKIAARVIAAEKYAV